MHSHRIVKRFSQKEGGEKTEEETDTKEKAIIEDKKMSKRQIRDIGRRH